jgi:hypothetical protein
MGFQPEGRGNQIWVRKSVRSGRRMNSWTRSIFVHLGIHHGYFIPELIASQGGSYHPLEVETASRRNDLVNQLPASNVHQLTGISTNIAPFAVRRLGCRIHHIFRVS